MKRTRMVIALCILATVSLMPTTAGAGQDSPVGRWILRVERRAGTVIESLTSRGGSAPARSGVVHDSRGQAVVLGLTMVLAGAIASPSAAAQAPWLVEVPEGVRTIELPVVPDVDRADRIELIRDLSIEPRGADPDYLFYQPSSVAVDDRGRMFVLDSGLHQIKAYGETGEHLATIGGEGRGPGEFLGPTRMALTGDRLIVTDARQARFSVWSLEGEHIVDHLIDRPVSQGEYVGLADGSLFGSVSYLDMRANMAELMAASQPTLAIFDDQGNRSREVARMPLVKPVALRRVGDNSMVYVHVDVPQRASVLVGTGAGPVYAADTSAYQVFAFHSSGDMAWALQVPWQRQILTEAEKNAALAEVRERYPDVQRSEIDFPELKPTLTRIAVDANGYLYVFPYAEVDRGEDRVVDVYSPAGERVFAGRINEVRWTAAHGDFVYAIEPDPVTEERTLVRYRIERPWR